MSKVIVIGAGASGMMAAIKASENNEVILLESNDKCGKKILLTGNGKCNYWNDDIAVKNYNTDNKELLENILSNQTEVLDFLYKLGLYPKIKNGYYYPNSLLAYSVREIFEKELIRRDIKVLYNSKVLKVEKKDKFNIYVEGDILSCDKLIIATGSKACSKTGSDGSGYDFAKSLGHKVNDVLPALTKILSNEFFLKEWNGIRQDARVTLYVDDKVVAFDEGELQMTQDGISGICTFNISALASKAFHENKKVDVKINFVPFVDNFKEFFENRCVEIPNQKISELLECILNYKLVNIILKRCNISSDAYYKSLTDKEKNDLIMMIESFPINVIGTNEYEKSQVCTGGVSLKAINEKCKSQICDDLYLVGEVLDVDGRCGGFNLAFAFISGYIAGSDIK